MALFDEYEVRGRTPAGALGQLSRALPRFSFPQREVLPEGTVRLEAPEQSISPELREAFLQGTMGGAAAGGAGKGAALVPYDLEARHAQEVLGASTTPRRAAADALARSRSGSFFMPEEVKAARGDYLRQYEEMFPGETRVRYGVDPASSSALKWRGVLPDGGTGYRPESFADPISYGPGERSSKVFRESLWDQTVGDAQRTHALGQAEEAAENMRRIAARRDAAKRVVKSGLRGMINPVNIAADALLGGTVGAAATGAGHLAGGGDRESAGLFTPPGEGYEGLVRAEDIERVIAQKELEKEAERQRLLEQYRASGYDLNPNTRLRDLR